MPPEWFVRLSGPAVVLLGPVVRVLHKITGRRVAGWCWSRDKGFALIRMMD
jgi:hypothetical protein